MGYLKQPDHPSGPVHSAPPMRSQPICNDWKRGYCARGPKCRFAHPMTLTEAVVSEQQRQYQPRYSLQAPSPSSTKLVIDKIPAEYCTIAAVHGHFAQFGTIVNIDLVPDQGSARIQYATAEEARLAHDSPEVIFNNRFVKVFWDTDQPTVARPAVARRMDPQEELLKKRKDTLDALVQLQKQKEALLLKYTEQHVELMARLNAADPASKPTLLEELKVVQSAIDSLKPPAPAQSPILRGGPLRRAPQAYSSNSASYKPYAKNPQSYKLDLRPRTIKMEPIPAKLGTDPAGIRKFFEPFGQVASLVVEPGSHATVTFLNRHDAEKAMITLSAAEDEAKFTWQQQAQQQ